MSLFPPRFRKGQTVVFELSLPHYGNGMEKYGMILTNRSGVLIYCFGNGGVVRLSSGGYSCCLWSRSRHATADEILAIDFDQQMMNEARGRVDVDALAQMREGFRDV